jgi:tRNA-splicing ligase RtcB
MTNFHQIDDAVWNYVHGEKKIATVIANDHIISSLENGCIQQLINASELPGLHEITLNPDAHQGYGVPVGSVLSSEDYLYLGSVGYDIKCSMSYLMLDLPTEEIKTLKDGRRILDAIKRRIGVGLGEDGKTGAGEWDGRILQGLDSNTLEWFEIPKGWAAKCEDDIHKVPGKDLMRHANERLEKVGWNKLDQLGSLGAGNHFEAWGLKDGCLGVLTHCGSRGLGHKLAGRWFKDLKVKFQKWGIPFIKGDKELVYLPVDSPERQ